MYEKQKAIPEKHEFISKHSCWLVISDLAQLNGRKTLSFESSQHRTVLLFMSCNTQKSVLFHWKKDMLIYFYFFI